MLHSEVLNHFFIVDKYNSLMIKNFLIEANIK